MRRWGRASRWGFEIRLTWERIPGHISRAVKGKKRSIIKSLTIVGSGAQNQWRIMGDGAEPASVSKLIQVEARASLPFLPAQVGPGLLTPQQFLLTLCPAQCAPQARKKKKKCRAWGITDLGLWIRGECRDIRQGPGSVSMLQDLFIRHVKVLTLGAKRCHGRYFLLLFF